MNALIVSAQQAHDAAVEGSRVGQYPAGAKAKLQAAINEAKTVAANDAATSAQVEQAIQTLDAALKVFQTSVITTVPGDKNNDGSLTIGDLALMAKSYGKTSADTQWETMKQHDLNADGKIDIVDLTIMARQILSW
ncbi:dockerin type I domain-containing protein [Paenibacillus aurantiacus]|uniref:Dockerin type I domain-containing protein n=1 Tax=Paenibacillus aurantiacus TaxID=1936118 RepID=A0ABV5KVN6_9BACL